ncbi:MAG: LPS translocon maturation chaperone LptM [Lysobacterales bacterium]
MKSKIVKRPKISLCLCGLSLALLAACGQKGPLFLPEPAPSPQQTDTPAPEEASGTSSGVATDRKPDPAKADDDNSP